MSFWAPVLHFLRQTRILPRIDAAIEYYDLPDLAFLVLLSAFPLFQILEHSTFWLLPVCVLLLLWFVRTLFRVGHTKLDIADFLVLLILLLQIAVAFTGYGRAEDALTAALLTSVWFPARRFFESRGDDALGFLSSLALFAVSAVGVGEYLFGMAELRWVDAARFGNIGGRVTSLFSNPNILAVYLLLYFPLSLWAIFSRQSRGRVRIFYTLTAALSAICILFTWSRGAWLGLGLECLLFLLLHSKKSRLLLTFLPPIALLSIPILPNSIRERLFSIADLGESSIRYRLQTWQGTCNMLGHHPVGIGVGEWAWRIIYPHHAVSGTARVMHAHNVFLQVATELGFAGLAVFLLLVIVSLRRALRSGNTTALCAVLGALAMGLFDHLWYYPGMLLPFWSMLAFCAQNRPKEVSKHRFVDILHEKSCNNI